MKRQLLDIEQLKERDIRWLLDRARALAAGAEPMPCHGSIANLFLEPSTRTRVSFELAARRVGLDVVTIEHASSSSSKGESLFDTAQTLHAMGVAVIVLRHRDEGVAQQLAQALGSAGPAIVNAGDGAHAHPSQALLDAAVLEAFGIDWATARIAILGDIRHSRVARSDLTLFHRLGARELRIVGPPEFMPEPGALPMATRHDALDRALEQLDALICLRIQRERIADGSYPDGDSFHQHWGLTEARAARLASQTRILHPGPVNRGVEIASAVLDSSRSLVLEQVRYGLHLRTALFEWLLEPDPRSFNGEP
ncbi:MAG: aspartate carbamoyltransferase catalytic subunit [Gammaproteobacteria bacterium HGW-Gammaproteobacteria-8]|nr:MAG: aspartate carbamoyltransferase catalytic subunit [Gammaproteobacteria bacterium HGW-Gammaproteobacteria-8]